jgi:hypothetical protein
MFKITIEAPLDNRVIAISWKISHSKIHIKKFQPVYKKTKNLTPQNDMWQYIRYSKIPARIEKS